MANQLHVKAPDLWELVPDDDHVLLEKGMEGGLLGQAFDVGHLFLLVKAGHVLPDGGVAPQQVRLNLLDVVADRGYAVAQLFQLLRSDLSQAGDLSPPLV